MIFLLGETLDAKKTSTARGEQWQCAVKDVAFWFLGLGFSAVHLLLISALLANLGLLFCFVCFLLLSIVLFFGPCRFWLLFFIACEAVVKIGYLVFVGRFLPVGLSFLSFTWQVKNMTLAYGPSWFGIAFRVSQVSLKFPLVHNLLHIQSSCTVLFRVLLKKEFQFMADLPRNGPGFFPSFS